MWSTLGTQLLGGAASQLGYTAGVGIAVESLILANQYALVPGFKAADIAITKQIWGEEAALKTEQDWYEVQEKYLNPVFNFVSITNATLTGKSKDVIKEGDTQNVNSLPISEPKLVYSQEGAVRDISKVGPAGSEAKTISDEETMSGNELIRVKMSQWEEENVKQDEESKKMLE